jgi:uncharacterized protein (TIRG00374 family)
MARSVLKTRSRISILVGIVVTLIFLGLALYNIDLRKVATALARTDYRYVGLALLCTFIGYLLRTVRWQVILTPAKHITLRRLYPVLMIGFMANNVLPLRIGEFARAYLLGRREAISKSLALATIVVERVFDGLTLIFFLVIVSLAFPLPAWGRQMEHLSLLIFGTALLGLVLSIYRQDWVVGVVSFLTRPLPASLANRLHGMVASFTSGITALRDLRGTAGLALSSLLVWILELSSYYLLTWAVPLTLSPDRRLAAAILAMVATNMGSLIPSSPGYVGPFEYFGTLALVAFGVEKELALSYTIVSHAMQYILVTGIGLLSLWSEGLTLASIDAKAVGPQGEATEAAPSTPFSPINSKR